MTITASPTSRHAVTLGETTFASKHALANYLQTLLRTHLIGEPILGDAGAILFDLLQRHPHAAQKVGIGIRGFTTRVQMYGHPGFVVMRRDGSETDFSYQKCLNGLSGVDCRSGDVESLLRGAVRPQLEAFRQTQPDPVRCPLSGRYVWSAQAHVDHRHPQTFRRLMDAFLDAEGLTIATFPLASSEDCRQGPATPDAALIGRWQAFHEFHADLRLIEAGANSRLGDRDPANDPAVRDQIAKLIAAAKGTEGEPIGRRRDAKRTHLLRLGAEIVRGRDELTQWLTDADHWLAENARHPEWEEREARWLERFTDYVAIEDALESTRHVP